MMLGAVSTGPDLALWSNANQFGIYPDSSGGLVQAVAKCEFDRSRPFHWRFGASLTARGDRQLRGQSWDKAFLVDEAYGSIGWKCLTLDLGMKHPDLDFYGPSRSLGSLSSTGGHLTYTGNSRSLPGYNLVLEKVAFPWTKEYLWFWGSFGDYVALDDAYTKHRLIHRTRLFTEVFLMPSKRLSLTLGIDHYGIWGGSSPILPPGQITFANWCRVVLGRGASAGGTQMDQANVLGDQGGSELIRLDWRGNGWKLAFQHEIPYSDKSGMRFQNFPDGVNTFSFSFDDKDRWVSDIVYEFYYTMYQSGPIHDEEFDEHGQHNPPGPGINFNGWDDYWNNGEYKSGWTYYSRPMTSPLFYPAGVRTGNVSRYGYNRAIETTNTAIENNRVIAHHIGIGGKLGRKAPYRLMLSLSQNYGTYHYTYKDPSPKGKPWGSVKEKPLIQFSTGFSGEIPSIGGIGNLSLTYGIFADYGQVLRQNVTLLVGLKYNLL